MLYDTYHIFYVPVNFPFNLPHYVTSYMHHTGKKETKKEIFKKRKKNAPSESVRTKSYRVYPLDDLGKRWVFEFKRDIFLLYGN